jgi:ADP-ribose pyrophosphatase YjhB (NUDIX family)
MNVSATLGAHTEPVALDGPKVHHLPQWGEFGDPKRMDVITRIAKMRGRDPRIATLAVQIIKKAGVKSRDYTGQAAALLKFVQTELYYVNEPGERLQDPLYTLKVGYGDCDDLSIMLGSLLESISLPWKLVISGTKKGKKVRYIQGNKFPGGEKRGYEWSHIYVVVGDRPFSPSKWYYAETTVSEAPFGWDVVDGDHSIFPEIKTYGSYGSYGAYGMNLNTNSPNFSMVRQLPTHSQSTPQTDLVIGGGLELIDLPQESDPTAPAIVKGQIRKGSGRAGRVRGAQQANSVAVIVLDPAGRVLLLRRSKKEKWQGGKWDLPGGPTHGALAAPAAQRILAKETGLKAPIAMFRGCSAVYHPSAGTSMFYVLRLSKKQAIKLTSQHSTYRFMSRKRIRKHPKTAPYVGIALRSCFAAKSLDAYSPIAPVEAPAITTLSTLTNGGSKMNLLGSYDSYMETVKKEYMGIPLWLYLAAGGAYYYYNKR